MTQIRVALLVLLFAAVSALEYDPVMGEEIFQYARVAYCHQDIIKSWDCEPCRRHPEIKHLQVFYNNSDNAQGYCGYDVTFNRVVVAIRGSVDTANYANDLNYFKTDYPRCKNCAIHRGFYETYENLANNLLACAYTLHSDYPEAEILVTGHSLGAAQAALAALEIKQLVGKVHIFYNFGTPRIGNEAFVKYLESELSGILLARIVRDKDTFHHLPTQTQGFVHYGNEIFYNDNMDSYKVCGREDGKCADKYFWPVQWKLNHHLYMWGQCAGCTQEGCENVI